MVDFTWFSWFDWITQLILLQFRCPALRSDDDQCPVQQACSELGDQRRLPDHTRRKLLENFLPRSNCFLQQGSSRWAPKFIARVRRLLKRFNPIRNRPWRTLEGGWRQSCVINFGKRGQNHRRVDGYRDFVFVACQAQLWNSRWGVADGRAVQINESSTR